MSRCGKTEALDALSAGELGADRAAELRAHAQGCARCRHELNWLDSERVLARRRAGRDEVQRLWKGTQKPARASRLAPALMALAASVLVVLGAGRLALPSVQESSPDASVVFDVAAQSVEAIFMSQELSSGEVCSRGGIGAPGFNCAAPLPASMLAVR